MMNPVGQGPMGPGIVQFDQKKCPPYFGDPRRDPAPINDWIKRIDNMKTAMGWDEGQTFSNAKNALFGPAADIMDTQCDINVNADYAETWAWLRKALKIAFDPCATSRSYVDLMFAMKPHTSIAADLDHSSAKIYKDFKQIREAITNTVVAQPAGGFDHLGHPHRRPDHQKDVARRETPHCRPTKQWHSTQLHRRES